VSSIPFFGRDPLHDIQQLLAAHAQGKSDFSVKGQHVNAPRPDPRKKHPEISAEMAQFILKAIDKDPDKRFQGCAEFLEYVKEYEESKLQRQPPLRKWLLVSLSIVAAIGVGVGIYNIVHQPPPTDFRHVDPN
jgi:hypothetical protein